jgi:hypothetical protein
MSDRDGRAPYDARVSEPRGSDREQLRARRTQEERAALRDAKRDARESPEARAAYRSAKRESRDARLATLEDRYALAAVLIVITIITTAIGGDHRWGQFVLVVVESATLIVILHASNVAKRTIKIVTIIVLVLAVATAISITLDRQSLGPAFVGGAIAFAGPVVIVRRIRDHARIDIETIAASLCIYLLAGIFFSYVYRILDVLDGQFFAQRAAAPAVDFIYFSFTTLTTTGYGDFTAGHSFGRMLAISEALVGQIYLVSVVALLVANLGRERRSSNPVVDDFRDEAPDDDGPEATA